MFSTYFQLGYNHIADLNAYDHMLFILALVCIYQISDFKKILILVTAFTIGHSLTLALATLNIYTVRADIIEFLIPLTIFITAIGNIAIGKSANKIMVKLKYGVALFFGLIHGLGFSNYLRMLLGKEEEIFLPLLAFNLGLEVGQILIVLVILLISVLAFQIFGAKQRDWNLFLSGICVGISLILMKETVFW